MGVGSPSIAGQMSTATMNIAINQIDHHVAKRCTVVCIAAWR
jgi:hypothetical protein